MFETVVIATDGSRSVERAVDTALDLAETFDSTAVHALYVRTAESEDERSERSESEREAARPASSETSETDVSAETALEAVTERADRDIETTVREGDPVEEICIYAEDVNADLVATGTRGRHGEHSFLLGSVAEGVARRCPVPVLTARQLEVEE